MIRKAFSRVSILILTLIVSIAIPASVLAGGVCGGTYIVDPGDTFNKIASNCGTTVSAITSANPGVTEPLKTGQALTVPGVTYNSTPIPPVNTPTPVNPPATTINNTYNTYNYYNNGSAPVSYNNTYIVQYGDTFSSIAYRYGVSVNDLWAANPYIVDINYIYAGMVIYVPTSSTVIVGVTPTQAAVPLSYGSVPFNAPKGRVTLSNKANGDVYVSLQGTTSDGTRVINEYPVSGQIQVKIPSGSYTYVAWVGGVQFEGWFQLGKDGEHKITFYANKVVVE